MREADNLLLHTNQQALRCCVGYCDSVLTPCQANVPVNFKDQRGGAVGVKWMHGVCDKHGPMPHLEHCMAADVLLQFDHDIEIADENVITKHRVFRWLHVNNLDSRAPWRLYVGLYWKVLVARPEKCINQSGAKRGWQEKTDDEDKRQTKLNAGWVGLGGPGRYDVV